jgi:hypothetical protein
MIRSYAEPRRALLALVGVQVLDALVNAVPNQWVTDDLEHLKLPRWSRFMFSAIKAASAVGLLLGLKWPKLGRLTARCLVAYFLLALGAHARVKDRPLRYGPAVAMLGWSALAIRFYPGEPHQIGVRIPGSGAGNPGNKSWGETCNQAARQPTVPRAGR